MRYQNCLFTPGYVVNWDLLDPEQIVLPSWSLMLRFHSCKIVVVSWFVIQALAACACTQNVFAQSFSPSSDWTQSGGDEPVKPVKKPDLSPVDMVAWCAAIQFAQQPIEIQVGLINRSEEVFFDGFPYFADCDFTITALRDGKPFDVKFRYPVCPKGELAIPGTTDFKKPNEVTDKSFSIEGLPAGTYSVCIKLTGLLGTDGQPIFRTVKFTVQEKSETENSSKAATILQSCRLGKPIALQQEQDEAIRTSVVHELLNDLKSDDMSVALTAARVMWHLYYYSEEKKRGIAEAIEVQSKKDKSNAAVHLLLSRLNDMRS
jgi:hypothetical protein